MNPNLGLPDQNRVAIIKILQSLLADEFVLYLKTRNAHWNFTGPHFGHLHKFFEEQYGTLEGVVDDVAERTRSLGGTPIATLAEMAKLARLKEFPGKAYSDQEFLSELTADHETLVRQLRKDAAEVGDELKDAGTNDFLIGLLQVHEKMAWMLRASLKE